MEELRSRLEQLLNEHAGSLPGASVFVQTVLRGSPESFHFGTCDEHTVFEIGSVTKVMTANLLQDMCLRGQVDLNDPLSKYLPEGVTAPKWKDQEIRLIHLATHTASLPRLPPNLFATTKDESDPYANYTEEDLWEAISKVKLKWPIGSRELYSNFGMGLLGHVLARKLGMSYEQAIQQRVLKPLGMADTSKTLTADQQARLAPGHDGAGKLVSNWDLAVLAGAGGLRSTPEDMLKYAQANLAGGGEIGQILRTCQEPVLQRVRSIDWSRWLWCGLLVMGGVLFEQLLRPSIWAFIGVFYIPQALAMAGGLPLVICTGAALTIATYALWGPAEAVKPLVIMACIVAYLAATAKKRRTPDDIPLGWQVSSVQGERMLWHNGGTGGYASFLGLIRSSFVAVVVLSNSARSVDDLALEILSELHKRAQV